MQEERMMILEMLKEGKITSEEALKLMDALEDEPIFEEKESKREKDFKSAFDALEDIGSDIEGALSKMFDGLKDFNPQFGFKSNYESITTNLDMDISDMESPSLNFRGVNDSITIRPIEGNTLFIKVTCHYRTVLLSANEPYFDFTREGNTIVFNPKYKNNISIKLNISLPEKHYDEITLKTSNGKIDLRDINSRTIVCKTSNGKIIFSGRDFERTEEIKLVTSNASISSELKNMNKEVTLDLETSIGNIDLGLPNLVYKTNKQVNLGLKKIVAHSLNYDINSDHLKFTGVTENASIKINSL